MTKRVHYHLFETAAGFAAIGWNDKGISSLRLPAASAHETERSLVRRFSMALPTEPPPAVRSVVDAVVRYFAGERVDFAAVPVDMGEQSLFFEQVYAFVRKLGWGRRRLMARSRRRSVQVPNLRETSARRWRTTRFR